MKAPQKFSDRLPANTSRMFNQAWPISVCALCVFVCTCVILRQLEADIQKHQWSLPKAHKDGELPRRGLKGYKSLAESSEYRESHFHHTAGFNCWFVNFSLAVNEKEYLLTTFHFQDRELRSIIATLLTFYSIVKSGSAFSKAVLLLN